MVFFFVAFLYLAYSTLEDAFQDGNQNSIAGTLYISVEKRSLYFNASGSFLFYPSEVTDEYLASNDLVFGYEFDEDLSVYQQSNEEQFVRELLNTVASYGSISISGSELSVTSLQEELSALQGEYRYGNLLTNATIHTKYIGTRYIVHST